MVRMIGRRTSKKKNLLWKRIIYFSCILGKSSSSGVYTHFPAICLLQIPVKGTELCSNIARFLSNSKTRYRRKVTELLSEHWFLFLFPETLHDPKYISRLRSKAC